MFGVSDWTTTASRTETNGCVGPFVSSGTPYQSPVGTNTLHTSLQQCERIQYTSDLSCEPRVLQRTKKCFRFGERLQFCRSLPIS